MITLSWGSATETGPYRAHNEDRCLTQLPIFVVADGMGGHAGGEEASTIAVTVFAELAGEAVSQPQVLQAFTRANEAIMQAARASQEYAHMGTTLAGLALVRDGGNELWFAFNAGDSRIYRLAGGVLELLSKDHSAVQVLIDSGAISEEERRLHPSGHIVTRVLGSDPAPAPDCWLLWPVAGERFLLCSDGVSGELKDEQIRECLLTADTPGAAADQLIKAALNAGSQDNATAVVIDVLGDVAVGADTVPRLENGSAA